MTTEEKLLQEIVQRLDKIESAIAAGSGELPVGVATETTLQAVNTTIAALKDGEFRIFSDPNDNNRLVGLSADMTNPASPIYVYKYLDTNAVYSGNVNDLETVGNVATNAFLEEIKDDTRIIRQSAVRADWEYTPGNSKVFTYYTGVEAGNPSGNTNLKLIEFKTGLTTHVTQTFAYNASDSIISVTTV